MVNLNEQQIILLLVCATLSMIGSLAGFASAYINRDVIANVFRRIFISLCLGQVSALLVFSMMVDFSKIDEVLLRASAFFALILGIWAGQIANRRIDDWSRTQTLIKECMTAKTFRELQQVVESRRV